MSKNFGDLPKEKLIQAILPEVVYCGDIDNYDDRSKLQSYLSIEINTEYILSEDTELEKHQFVLKKDGTLLVSPLLFSDIFDNSKTLPLFELFGNPNNN